MFTGVYNNPFADIVAGFRKWEEKKRRKVERGLRGGKRWENGKKGREGNARQPPTMTAKSRRLLLIRTNLIICRC